MAGSVASYFSLATPLPLVLIDYKKQTKTLSKQLPSFMWLFFSEYYYLTSICSSVQLSKLTDLTRDIWTPKLRWIPAHLIQINTPKFHEAHLGPVVEATRTINVKKKSLLTSYWMYLSLGSQHSICYLLLLTCLLAWLGAFRFGVGFAPVLLPFPSLCCIKMFLFSDLTIVILPAATPYCMGHALKHGG